MSPASANIILQVSEAGFYHRQHLLFDKINWTIQANEQWAIVGPTGSGKSSLVNAITGKYLLRNGHLSYPFLEKFRPSPDAYLPIKDFIALVTFSEDSSLLNYSNFYYQQRFNAAHTEGIITAQAFLEKALPEGSSSEKLDQIARLLGIAEVLPLEFIKLSNGQTRKLRIAKALLADPLLLILDNPFIGLDTATREELTQMIDRLIRQGKQVILTTSSPDFPQGITHVLELENFRIKHCTTKESYLNQHHYAYLSNRPRLEPVSMPISGIFLPEPDFTIAFQFKNVTVKYDDKPALQDINWTVRKGEKWALLGPNGSGKSTLLSLINGDHPQAYANHILLFDKPRGSGESIWEIKQRIGFVSPELHLYFKQNIQCREVAASGYVDALYFNKKISDEQQQAIADHFGYFGISHLLQESFQSISSGQQRLVLLIRSLIKGPEVIIWDEPYQALDQYYINLAAKLLQQYCTPSTTLIFVSHYPEEIPRFVDKYLYLDGGRISKTDIQP
jgi:molybdate transport system ATP-binding protein